MEPEIRPEPTPAERAAILAALERLLSDGSRPPVYRSAWREAGIRENLDSPEEEAWPPNVGDVERNNPAEPRPRGRA
jgi:hypothetical protein